MICAFPISRMAGGSWPCGQCQPCRTNTLRKKVTRLLLEARCHASTVFVTLTYNDHHLPRAEILGEVIPVLYPRDLTLFLKRLRDRLTSDDRPQPFRYFAVGEYGSETWRPHYHAMLFGCTLEELDPILEKTWGMGFVQIGEATDKRMHYIAHYTAKKMTQVGDDWLHGRPPEFMRCSRRPGIGYNAVKGLCDYFHTKAGSIYLQEMGDVTRTIRVDGKVWPLDYYMLQKLREEMGIPVKSADRLSQEPLPEPTDTEQAEALKRHNKMFANKNKHGTL